MKKRKVIPFLVLLIAIVGVVYYANRNIKHSSEKVQSGKIQVTASFYPLYFFASQIGGDKANVANVVPSGAEPHDYEPTAKDMAGMEKSNLIILNGGGLEAWGADIQKNIDIQKTKIVFAGEGLTTEQMMEEGKARTDPHVWLAPSLAKMMVDKIAQGFKTADSSNDAYYQANADKLKKDLEDLDQEYKKGLSNCSEKNIITSHAAFGYMAKEYGLNQVSIAGLSPDAEPSPSQLADISNFAKANNVKYIFFESLVSPKLSETIASEVGAKTLVLNPMEGLSEEEIANGENYLTAMRDNLINLKIALQCQ
ncbi:MAG: zinc ABC transporter solute-binding protein [Candidatus Moranbacteria bacterium]|nr:zinc ABC transporter solute-binding protein [Candidatus Moranbacteria bacterium]